MMRRDLPGYGEEFLLISARSPRVLDLSGKPNCRARFQERFALRCKRGTETTGEELQRLGRQETGIP